MCFVDFDNQLKRKRGAGWKLFAARSGGLYSTLCAPTAERLKERFPGVWLTAKPYEHESTNNRPYSTGWTIFKHKKDALRVQNRHQKENYGRENLVLRRVKFRGGSLQGPVNWFSEFETPCIQADEILIMEDKNDVQ